jgi:hypothetical protein
MDKILYAWHHRAEIAAWFIAFATAYTVLIATPLARAIKRPPADAAWWKRALYDLAIDTPSWLAALERSGILGGIFNVPGVPSRKPEDNPTPAASKMRRIAKQSDRSGMIDLRGLVPIALALGLLGGAASCGSALGRCEVNAIPQALEGLLVRVAAALFMPGADWTAQLEQAGKDAAPAQVACLVQGVTGYLEEITTRRGQADDRFVEAQRRGRMFLQAHPASASCPPLPLRALAFAVQDVNNVPYRNLPSVAEVGDHRLFGGAGATAAYSAGPGPL